MARTDELAEELRVVLGTLVRRVRAESAGQEVSWPQGAALRRLDADGAMTIADLARVEHMKPQTMGALIAELEENGLVERADDPADGRRKLISLTRAGARALADRRAARRTWLSDAIDKQLDPGEQKQLTAALALLRRLSAS